MKSTVRTINNKYKTCFIKNLLVTTPLYASSLDNNIKIKFIEEKTRISTINIGAEVNTNLCMKIDHGCSLYVIKLWWPSSVKNAKKLTIGNSIKTIAIFFHLSFFCTIGIALCDSVYTIVIYPLYAFLIIHRLCQNKGRQFFAIIWLPSLSSARARSAAANLPCAGKYWQVPKRDDSIGAGWRFPVKIRKAWSGCRENR